ncbi:MAG: tetratricopeptide repeat protein [Gemmatimonadaceae bacterium]
MSSAERWRRIEALFEEGAAQPAAEQAAWLRRACPDEDMRADLARLLEADRHDAGADVIEGAVRSAVEDLAAEGSRVGSMIAHWRLLREIGHGGMGTVYLAERADGRYEGRVAIKFLRGGFGSPERKIRFLAERQIVADLEHPFIARLLDAGETPDGTPYFVMEYVDGDGITAYADRNQLGLDARLQLFRRACDAVQRAHESLVVHRDLKPSNILVTPDGNPKLVDFGIAKLIDAEHAAATETGAAGRLLTPAYASPEQIAGKRVTVQSDVYSLGVVLYELLTGRNPFVVPGVDGGNVERLVLEHDPLLSSVAGHAWSRELRGDLDTIVLKAMHKDPARRYSSVAALAEDLRRQADGEPVLARRDSWGYRAGKFVRRNRAAVGAGSGALLLVVLLTVMYTLRLSTERDRQRIAARQAGQVSSFLIDLFTASDPNLAQGREVTARELLERGSLRLDSMAIGDPELRSRLAGVIGKVYFEIGRFAAADSTLRHALALRRTAVPQDDSVSADILDDLSNTAVESGRDEAADSFAAVAVGIRRRAGRPTMPLSVSLNRQGSARRRMGNYAVAESLFVESLEIRERLLGADHAMVADILSDLSLLLQDMGRNEDALEMQRRATDIRERRLGPDDPSTYNSYHNMAWVHGALGQYQEAESWTLRALAAGTRVLGANHPRVLSTTVNYVGFLTALKRFHEADSVADDAARRLSRLRGTELRLAAVQRLRAEVKSALGQHDAAISLARAALETNQRVRGDHPYTQIFARTLGTVLAVAGRPTEARRILRDALAAQERLLGSAHVETNVTRAALDELAGTTETPDRPLASRG